MTAVNLYITQTAQLKKELLPKCALRRFPFAMIKLKKDIYAVAEF